jgi:stage II sporulation protein P
VLILHTHTTESFAQTEDRYEESSPYRTLDPGHNMIALGDIVADILTQAGIGVIHDRQFHDYPSYNGSYNHAAASTKAYLDQYPTIELILDLHRDAADTPTGQMVTACSVGGEKAAQLMFVLGTDKRLNHPDWEKNLSLALKLQVLLEKENPGICRDLTLSQNRYNQHLGNTALLIEIGAAGNTLDQAKLAARELGEAITKLVLSSEG